MADIGATGAADCTQHVHEVILQLTSADIRWCAQIVDSDTGPTITGIELQQRPAFLHELATAVLSGALPPDKFAVGIKAAGLAEGCSEDIADLFWCALLTLGWSQDSCHLP